MVVGYIHQFGILYGARKYILLGVKMLKLAKKTEFGSQTQYGCVYSSIGNLTWSKKNYTFGGSKWLK
jgi:hypothetical protein